MPNTKLTLSKWPQFIIGVPKWLIFDQIWSHWLPSRFSMHTYSHLKDFVCVATPFIYKTLLLFNVYEQLFLLKMHNLRNK